MPSLELLIIGGGGGGGSDSNYAGGGGAGELIHLENEDVALGEHSISVGDGGVADANGENSSFDAIAALGGGAGGDRSDSSGGNNGGSGGGGGDEETGGTATPNQGLGNNGGDGSGSSGGGGGGAGEAGQNAPSSTTAGDGGDGVQVDITGSLIYYAGGGAGARGTEPGGLGGGGDSGVAGEDGKGAGGGGGASGGSGVVIVRYLTADAPSSSGGTTTTDGDYTIHTFESDGTFVLAEPPVVQTDDATEITHEDAVLNGEAVEDSGLGISEIGFVWDTSSQSAPGDVAPGSSGYSNSFTLADDFELGTYSTRIFDLALNTQYYFRFYIKSDGVFVYGDEATFTTLKTPLEIDVVDPPGANLNETPQITISGSNFRDDGSGITVDVDGDACTSITVVDSETITCNVPSSSEVKTSTLTVTNPDGVSDTIDFYYITEAEAPTQPDPVVAEVDVQPIEYTR